MSDDMLMHFSSNSSSQTDQSLPTKMAKLEARMVGKASSASATATQSQQPTTWPAATKISGLPENMVCEPLSSDSDDDVSLWVLFFMLLHYAVEFM